jgi:RNA polymerase sigma-70 factor (ECF subfamily)
VAAAYPDGLLEGIAESGAEPGELVVAMETIELAFLAAIQLLPPRQRAMLILRDVLGWSAKETASLLEASVASANSALQQRERR